MNAISKTIESLVEKGRRIVKILRYGEKDNLNTFLMTSFGEDCNIPKDYKALYVKTSNSADPVCIGIINKVILDDLNAGDKQIFSTNETGDTIAGFIKLLNDGTMEFNGNDDFIAGFNKLKEGFDELKADYNNHIHQIPIGEVIIDVTGGSGAPAVGVPNSTPIDLSNTDINSEASIDSSKKINLKIK